MDRKVSVLVFILFVFQINSYAQYDVGVKSGINIAFIRSATNSHTYQFEELQPKVGFLGGIYGSLKLSKNVDLNLEILYSEKGYRIMKYRVISNWVGSDPYMVNVNINYITVPVSFVFHVIPSLGLTLGTEFGNLISANSASDNDGTDDRYSYYSTYELGLNAGIKYYFLKRFNFDIRYTYGLTNMIKDPNLINAIGNPAGEIKDYNMAWQFSLSYDLWQRHKPNP